MKEIKNSSRFRSPVKESEYSEAVKGVIPANTKKCTNWAVRVFESWINECSVRKPEDPIPENILQCHDKAIVCKYMRYFVLKKQGTLSQMKRSLDSFNTSLDFRTVPLTSTKHLKVLNLTCFIWLFGFVSYLTCFIWLFGFVSLLYKQRSMGWVCSISGWMVPPTYWVL